MLLVARVVQAHNEFNGFDAAVYYYGGAKAFLNDANPYLITDVVSPPSGLLLIAPLRMFSFEAAAIILQVVSAVSLSAALYLLLTRLLNQSRTTALMGAFLVAGIAAPAYSTTGLGNLNGPLLFSFVLALVASLDGNERRVGFWMGVGFAIKPVLAPIWIVLLIQRRWKAAGWSFAVPAVGSVIAIAINPKTLHFIDDGLPNIFANLSERFPNFDVAIGAVVRTADLPNVLTPIGRLVAVALTAGIAWMVWQRQDHATNDDETRTLDWIELGAVVFLGYLLASTFAWRYYVVYLFPIFVLALKRTSLAYNPLVWIGAVLLLLPDDPGAVGDNYLPQTVRVVRQTGSITLVLLGLGWAVYALRRDRLRADTR